ncbi:hypothetical protein VTN02DRAFT_1143 [Thermoascus thermophilus]
MIALRLPVSVPVQQQHLAAITAITVVGRVCGASRASARWTSTRPRPHPSRFSSTSTSTPRITYRIAAATSAKTRPFRDAAQNVSVSVYDFDPSRQDVLGVNPNPGHNTDWHRPDSGEDAFFVAKVGGRNGQNGQHDARYNGAVAFGVADGVGGWAEAQVDPADFSHGLCGYMAGYAVGWKSPAAAAPTATAPAAEEEEEQQQLRPTTLLQHGYDRVSWPTSEIQEPST